MTKSNYVLVSIGMTVFLSSFLLIFTNYELSVIVVLALSVFTLLIAISDFSSNEKTSRNLLISAFPISFFLAVLALSSNASDADIEKFATAFTVMSLGVVIISISFEDNKKNP